MFEDYIQDAYAFYELASRISQKERDAKMFYRAAVFCAASSLEAFVNFLGDTFSKGGKLDKIEIAFLNDKTLEIDPPKASIEERVRFNSIDSKVKFIIKRFQVPIDPATSLHWTHFLEFKSLRDSLVHPRNLNDEVTLQEYKSSLKKGLNAIIEIINSISTTIFTKSLRKSLLDLKIQ